MSTAPYCSKLAVSNLLGSCRSLSADHIDEVNDSHTPKLSLYQVKDIYAARLAVCELETASVAIPKSCKILQPSETKVKRTFYGYLAAPQEQNGPPSLQFPKVRHDQVTRCVHELNATPQSWTSYSNARQNAVAICEAVRADIERGEW